MLAFPCHYEFRGMREESVMLRRVRVYVVGNGTYKKSIAPCGTYSIPMEGLFRQAVSCDERKYFDDTCCKTFCILRYYLREASQEKKKS